MYDRLTSHRNYAILLFLIAAAMMAAVYAFEFIGGLAPCILCLYQRIPWWLVIGSTSMALNFNRIPGLRAVFILLCGVLLLAGAGIAGYHVGVEWLWWEGPSSCTGIGNGATDLESLKSAIMTAPVVRCDEIPWSFLGLSMAGWNFVISLPLGLFTLYVGWNRN